MDGPSQVGTVFKITPGGTSTTIHSFCIQQNCPDGFNPIAGLIQATNGNFYGTTSAGGAEGVGTVFEITPAGVLTTLHNFDSTDCVPNGSLVQATDGSFYGAATLCGTMAVYSNGDGTIFKITPTGTFATLHSFDATDGAQSYSLLVQGTDGTLYVERRDLDLASSRMHVHFIVIDPNGNRHESIGHIIRLYTLTEMTRLLARVGLTVNAVHGGFEGETYSIDTRRMIIVARKE